MFIAEMIGLGVFTACMIIAVWRLNVEGNNIECDGCCNPDHWELTERMKLTEKEYHTMKQNIEREKQIE